MPAKEQRLPDAVSLENIEEMRLQAGIEDHALRKQVGQLEVGDLVKVTLLISDRSLTRETLQVRITGIRRGTFSGQLVGKPASAGLRRLRPGLPIAFTRDHIHSAGQTADGHGAEVEEEHPLPRLVGQAETPAGTSRKGPPMSASRKSELSPPRNGILPALLSRADTTAERLRQIAALGERISEYVEFIGEIDKLTGTSGEAKEAAVDAFHRQMVALEHRLAKIQEELRLG